MNSQRTVPPFRADHVGSLLRPPALRDAHAGFKAGKVTEQELQEIQDRAIRDVVRMQESVGLESVTDGEFRRDNWRDRFFESVSGYSVERYDSPFNFTESSGETLKGMPIPHVVGKLKRMKSMAKDEFAFLKQTARKTAKLTLPSPITNHFYLGDKNISQAYGSRAEYLDDIASIYKQELADLAAVGCNYLQLDEVCLAIACDPRIRQIAEQRGEEFNELLIQYTNLINTIVDSRPAGMRICMHLCRGNQGKGIASGGYEPIADFLFGRMHVNAYFLEYDTERAGDFTPLRFMPKNKQVVLGMVSTKLKELESIDELKWRVEEASKFVDMDQLCLSPQCGFASGFFVARFSFDDQKRKLAHLVEAANRIWN